MNWVVGDILHICRLLVRTEKVKIRKIRFGIKMLPKIDKNMSKNSCGVIK